MADQGISRRQFVQTTAAVAAGATVLSSAQGADNIREVGKAIVNGPDEIKKTRSYNPQMEYRRLGKTGIYVSAVCMGGHWKRIDKMIGSPDRNLAYAQPGGAVQGKFEQNRYDVVTRCIEHGINLIDACTGGEVMAYAKALKGRRDKMYLNYSWYEKEMRMPEWRTTPKLLHGLEEGLRAAGLEYIDLWRITCHEKGSNHTEAETEQFIKALETAKKQGKCRFTGISSHDRPWLKKTIEKYPEVMQVIVSPYTAASKELPTDSLFATVKQFDVGWLGIKPFASNSLFKGDSSLNSPTRDEDDKLARLAIRYILGNPAITAPIPGLVNAHQVDNVVAAVKEKRELDDTERAELQAATDAMWARLPADYQWLKEWQHV